MTPQLLFWERQTRQDVKLLVEGLSVQDYLTNLQSVVTVTKIVKDQKQNKVGVKFTQKLAKKIGKRKIVEYFIDCISQFKTF